MQLINTRTRKVKKSELEEFKTNLIYEYAKFVDCHDIANGKRFLKGGIVEEFAQVEVSIDCYIRLPYEEIINKMVREKYTIEQELAIQRQRDTKVEKFTEYNNFVEDAKTQAKAFVEERKALFDEPLHLLFEQRKLDWEREREEFLRQKALEKQNAREENEEVLEEE